MKNRISLLAILSLVFAQSAIFLAPVNAAITSTSISGLNIATSSTAISTAITPSVTFTLGTALVVDAQTIEIVLNGTTVAPTKTVNAASVSMTCNGVARTLENSPGTPDNGNYELTVVNGASTNNNPDITIILDNSAGPVAPTCPSPIVVTVAATTLTSSATAGNYAITIDTPFEATAFFYYVGNENLVNINATVDPSISFVIRNTADTLDQTNVNLAAVGPNLCNLGNLTTAGVQTCSYRLKIATNAAGGYSVNITTDGNLRQTTSAKFITNIINGTSVSSGVEGYGIQFAAGASNVAGSTVAAQGIFATNDSPIGTGTNATLYTSTGPNNPTGTDTTNTALVTHKAEASAATPAGTYSHLVTYTVTGSF